jgi:hypothetical protein
VVLGKHHNSFLQVSTETNTNIAKMLQHSVSKIEASDSMNLRPADMRMVQSFVQNQSGEDVPAYNPGSGEIFGILKNMKETFEGILDEELQTVKNIDK